MTAAQKRSGPKTAPEMTQPHRNQANVSPAFRVSTVRSVKLTKATAHSLTLQQLAELIERTSGGSKKDLPLLSMAVFDPPDRAGANIVSETGTSIDADAGVVLMSEAVEALRDARIRAVAYRSPSSGPDGDKFRLFLPWSNATGRDDVHRKRMALRLHGLMGKVFAASESVAESQCFYFGSAGGKAIDLRVIDGPGFRGIDDAVELDPLVSPGLADFVAGKARSGVLVLSSEPWRRKVVEGLDFHNSTVEAAWECGTRGLSARDAVAEIEAVFDQHDGPRADRCKEARADIPRVVADKYRKYGLPRQPKQEAADAFKGDPLDADEEAARRDRQRRRAQEIGDGTADVPPTPRLMNLGEMLEGVVFIADGARVAYRDRPQISLPFAEFKSLTKASKTWNGQRNTATADAWLESSGRITTHTVTYRPGAPEFTADPEGADALNLWRPRVRVASSASVDAFLGHVEYLVPIVDERERFLSWLAHIEQFPGVLPHTHYLMVTRQTGIGRNWLASLLARVWAGATRLGFDLMGAMRSGFNGGLSRRLLTIVDELKAADGHYGAQNTAEQLKALLTTEHRGINPKFGRQHIEFNCNRFLMLSQHYDALPLAREDRRIIVISNPTERRPEAYYTRLYGMLEDPDFVNAVANWLADRDLRGFNPSAPAPMTESKQLAVEAATSELEKALVQLKENTTASLITVQHLHLFLKENGVAIPQGRAMSAGYAAAGMVPCHAMVKVSWEAKKQRVVAMRDTARLQSAPAATLRALLEAERNAGD